MSTTLDRIRARRETGKTMDQIQAEQNTDAMFWAMTMVAGIMFLAVAVWKFFFFQVQISAPVLFWERFLEASAAGASEVFRMGSLIMAYYESKKGRKITVWFGILISLSIMAYDIHLGSWVTTAETFETYIFFCLFSELIGIRAIFGYAFEEALARPLKVSKPAPETKEDVSKAEPETKPIISKDTTIQPAPQDISPLMVTLPDGLWEELVSEPAPDVSENDTGVSKNDIEVICVDGFKAPLSASDIKSKIGQYQWKLDQGLGRDVTNRANIQKLSAAYEQLTGKSLYD